MLKPHEIKTIYVGPKDRFVVSLIVGYTEHDGGVATPKEAARAALQLTRDEGSSGTYWHVFDRKTSHSHNFEQGEFE